MQDPTGNGLGSSVASAPVTVDNTPPQIAIGAPSVESTVTGPVSYLVTYVDADNVTLSADDVQLAIEGASTCTVEVTGEGDETRVVTVLNIEGNGTIGIRILGGTATDAAGNVASATGQSRTFTVELGLPVAWWPIALALLAAAFVLAMRPRASSR